MSNFYRPLAPRPALTSSASRFLSPSSSATASSTPLPARRSLLSSSSASSRLTARSAPTRPTPLASWVRRKRAEKEVFANPLDVITIERSGEHFRLLYDIKGRFTIHRITPEEATFKLCKVRRAQLGAKGVPYIVTHDGRTIRYPDPSIKVNDTIKYDFVQNKIVDHVKFEPGNVVMITGGRNMGRSGVIVHTERHLGGFDVVHIRDVLDRTFATRVGNVFVIGEGAKAQVSLPKGKGLKLSIAEERDQRRARREA